MGSSVLHSLVLFAVVCGGMTASGMRRDVGKNRRCFKKVTNFSKFHSLRTQNARTLDQCFSKCQRDPKCLAVSNVVGKTRQTCSLLKKRNYGVSVKRCGADGRCSMVFMPEYHKNGSYESNLPGNLRGRSKRQCNEQCLRNPLCTSIYFYENENNHRHNSCTMRATVYNLIKRCQKGTSGTQNCRIVHGEPDYSNSESSKSFRGSTLDNYKTRCGNHCLNNNACYFVTPRLSYARRRRRYGSPRVDCQIYVRRASMLNVCKDHGRKCDLKPVNQNVIWALPYYVRKNMNFPPNGLERCIETCKQYGERCYGLQYGRNCRLILTYTIMKKECFLQSGQRVCKLVKMGRNGTKSIKVRPETGEVRNKTFDECAKFCDSAKCTGLAFESSSQTCRVFGITSQETAFYFKACKGCKLKKMSQRPPNTKYLYVRLNRRRITPTRCKSTCKRRSDCTFVQINHDIFRGTTRCSFYSMDNRLLFFKKISLGSQKTLVPSDFLSVANGHQQRQHWGARYNIKVCWKMCMSNKACLGIAFGNNRCTVYSNKPKKNGRRHASGQQFAPDMNEAYKYFSWSQVKKQINNYTDSTKNAYQPPSFYGKVCNVTNGQKSCDLQKVNYTKLGFRYPGEFNSYASHEKNLMNGTEEACAKKCRDAWWCVGVMMNKLHMYNGMPAGDMPTTYMRRRAGSGNANSLSCRFFHFVNIYKKTCSTSARNGRMRKRRPYNGRQYNSSYPTKSYNRRRKVYRR